MVFCWFGIVVVRGRRGADTEAAGEALADKLERIKPWSGSAA